MFLIRFFDWVLKLCGLVLVFGAGLALLLWFAPWQSDKKLAHVFGWGGIEREQKYKILWQLDEPAAPISGDYLSLACLELEKFKPSRPEDWVVGPETESVYKQARELALTWPGTSPRGRCLNESDTAGVRMFIWEIVVRHRRVTAARVMLFEESTKRLLYFGFKV